MLSRKNIMLSRGISKIAFEGGDCDKMQENSNKFYIKFQLSAMKWLYLVIVKTSR